MSTIVAPNKMLLMLRHIQPHLARVQPPEAPWTSQRFGTRGPGLEFGVGVARIVSPVTCSLVVGIAHKPVVQWVTGRGLGIRVSLWHSIFYCTNQGWGEVLQTSLAK